MSEPDSELRFATCAECGSAEMVSAATIKCPGCGSPYSPAAPDAAGGMVEEPEPFLATDAAYGDLAEGWAVWKADYDALRSHVAGLQARIDKLEGK